MSLFEQQGAEFSHDRKFRYSLWRIWDKSKPLVMFIGLNPSTANESKSDNTITKVRKIASSNGYGGFFMMNLFPHITPHPAELPEFSRDIYKEQWQLSNAIRIWTVSQKCKDVVFAWGSFKQAEEKQRIYRMIFYNALCLHINKNGSPKHPLYCRDDSKLIPFK